MPLTFFQQIKMPFFISGYGYGSDSVKKLEALIIKCKNLVKDTNCLWFSLQANLTNDWSSTVKGFEEKVKKMLNKLENEHKFFIPQFSLNMRNSSTIGGCAKGVKGDSNSSYKMNENDLKNAHKVRRFRIMKDLYKLTS